MTWEAWATIAVVGLILYLLATNAASPDVSLGAGAGVLMTLGLLSPNLPTARDAASAFGNEALLTIAALFVVVAGLTDTGAIHLITDRVLGRPRSDLDAQVRLMVPVAAMSAFVNNTPIVAMFMPVVNDWSRRAGIAASKLFIPLSYAAILGGGCTLIGTSTNLVVNALMIDTQRSDPAMPVMTMFTISPVGIPVALVGLAYLVIAAPRLLPDRGGPAISMEERREYTVEMYVEPKGPLPGRSIEDAGLRRLPGMFLSAIERDTETIVAVGPEQRLLAGDRLVFVGVVESVADLQRIRGLSPATDQVAKMSSARHERCLVEAVVSPSSPVAGQSVRDGRFRTRYDAVVLAVHREGERIAKKVGDIVLRGGDLLLLETHPRFLKYQRSNRDFVLASPVSDSAPPRRERAWVALALLAGMVAAASLESFTRITMLHAAWVTAGAMVVTRCCSVERARASLDLSVLFAIGSALLIGRAMQTSGLATSIATQMSAVVAPTNPRVMLAAIYLLTLLFTELLANAAAAALVFPIAYAWTTAAGLHFLPFGISIAVAASAGFASPLGYQTHLMVYGIGGYRFTDFVRIGVPLDLLAMAITVAIAPVAFPF
jgi:di/tricarboxylate transporter